MRRNIHAIYQKYIKIAHKTEGKKFKAISYFLLFFNGQTAGKNLDIAPNQH